MSGILDIDAATYHADRVADQPTLSRSVAHVLCTQSPAHAKQIHPRLNPDYEPDDGDGKFDVGTACHQLIFGGETVIAVIEAKDYKTKAAQEERYIARCEGKTPMLAHQWIQTQEMAEAVKARLAEWPFDLLGEGDYETTLTWEDEGAKCRGRLDFLSADRSYITDLKTSSRSAAEWSLFNSGYDLQAFMYRRAVELTLGVEPRFFFVIAESFPPFELRVIEPGPDVYALARRKFAYAAGVWRECLASGEWPGYPRLLAVAELPAWVESRWLEKELREEMVA